MHVRHTLMSYRLLYKWFIINVSWVLPFMNSVRFTVDAIIDFEIRVIILVIETLLLMLMCFSLYLWLIIIFDISARAGLLLCLIFFRKAFIECNSYVCLGHILNSSIVILLLISSKVSVLVKLLLG